MISSKEPESFEENSNFWVNTEFDSIDLGDARLNNRAVKVLDGFFKNPQQLIPESMGSWPDIKGAYRFIDNPKVTHKKLLKPHIEATQIRMKDQKIVLAVQDTTELNYTAHPAVQGLGTIGSKSNLRGMQVHTTIAFTPERVPLGIIDQQSWIRPVEEFGKRVTCEKRPIEEKESKKWFLSLKSTEAFQAKYSESLFVNIGDREADIYDLFKLSLNFKSKILVRACRNRRIEHEEKYLWPHMEAQPLAEKLAIKVPVKKSKKLRTAKVEIRFTTMNICPPSLGRRRKEDSINIFSVYLKEPNPPKDTEPLSWMLLTTLPVEDVQDALTIVQYYGTRWGIEIFHRVLKSGCKIEKRQLQTAERLRTCLALDSIVAWRILFLTTLGRETPDLPCDVVFEEYEWKSLYCYVNDTTEPPQKPPSLCEAVKLVAQIGGFIGRKSDGFPGTKVLWRGLQKLSTISFAWLSFGPGRKSP